MSELPTAPDGRHVWIVTWGTLARANGYAVLALAYDAEEALALGRAASPERLPPDAAHLATASTAAGVLAGAPPMAVAHLPVVE